MSDNVTGRTTTVTITPGMTAAELAEVVLTFGDAVAQLAHEITMREQQGTTEWEAAVQVRKDAQRAADDAGWVINWVADENLKGE